MPTAKRKSKKGYYYENAVVSSKSNNAFIDKLTKKSVPVKKVEEN